MNNICNISYSFLYKCINILNLLNKIYTIFKYENGKKSYLNMKTYWNRKKNSNYVIIYIYIYIYIFEIAYVVVPIRFLHKQSHSIVERLLAPLLQQQS